MDSKSNNTEVMTYDNANETFKEIFESTLSRYEIKLETSMKRSDFILDGINLLYCKYHKINLFVGGSYLGSPD